MSVCEKCGHDDISVAFHKIGCDREDCNCAECSYGSHNKCHEEHLHYHCRTCRYDWTGPLTPARALAADGEGNAA